MKTEEKVSIRTIAKEIGVSRSVVSAVLSETENKNIFVSKEKKERILNLVKEYNYIKPKSAIELAKGKSDTIGIIFHVFTPYFGELITEIQKEALKNRLDISIYYTDNKKNLEELFLEQSRDGRVDGLIVLGWGDKGSPERYLKFSQSPYNIKILSHSTIILNLPTITFDEKMAGILAYKHLKQIGCKTYGCIGGPKGNNRIGSFCNEAKKDGKNVICFSQTGFTENWEEKVLIINKFFKETKNIPEGIFCSNDMYAIGLISKAQGLGINVPKDMAVIGCDNTQVCCYSSPFITSIDTNKKETAKKSIEIIKKLIQGERPEPIHTIIPVSLVQRESTKR